MSRGQGTGELNRGWLKVGNEGQRVGDCAFWSSFLVGVHVLGQGSWSLTTWLTGSWTQGVRGLRDVHRGVVSLISNVGLCSRSAVLGKGVSGELGTVSKSKTSTAAGVETCLRTSWVIRLPTLTLKLWSLWLRRRMKMSPR